MYWFYSINIIPYDLDIFESQTQLRPFASSKRLHKYTSQRKAAQKGKHAVRPEDDGRQVLLNKNCFKQKKPNKYCLHR